LAIGVFKQGATATDGKNLRVSRMDAIDGRNGGRLLSLPGLATVCGNPDRPAQATHPTGMLVTEIGCHRVEFVGNIPAPFPVITAIRGDQNSAELANGEARLVIHKLDSGELQVFVKGKFLPGSGIRSREGCERAMFETPERYRDVAPDLRDVPTAVF
jgi:hypothetical protein